MDLDTLIATLREEHGIDVPALQRSAAEAETFASLSSTLTDALVDSEVLALSSSDGTATAEDIVAAVTTLAEQRVELSSQVVELSSQVTELVKESTNAKAAARVDELIGGGFILPVKRDASIKLLLTDAETFDELLPEKPLVELSSESGREIQDENPAAVIEAEIERLAQDAASQGLNVAR